MAFRFRRSIRLAPGLRLNLGKRGVSLSAGVRGASVTLGKNGTYANVGIPGTGLSVRNRIDGRGTTQRQPRQYETDATTFSVTIRLNSDGNVEFLDGDENPLPEHLVRQARQQQGEFIRQWLIEECEKINLILEELETIYRDTPPPNQAPSYIPDNFTIPEPVPPTPKPLGILGRLFKRTRSRIEKENTEAQSNFDQAMRDWKAAKSAFEGKQEKRRRLVEEEIYSSMDAMHQLLEERLQEIAWPRETNVSFEITKDGKCVYIDVDLPEIEDMPTNSASLPARGWRVSMRQLTDTKKRQLYMNHIHGVGFRLIGETFSTLPTARSVVLSAYSQRPDKATGKINDEYLYSIRVAREDWEEIDFGNLSAIDVVESLAQFDLLRRMTKTGIFKPIEPYAMT